MSDTPVQDVTCCTPRPNVYASYICTTNVNRELWTGSPPRRRPIGLGDGESYPTGGRYLESA